MTVGRLHGGNPNESVKRTEVHGGALRPSQSSEQTDPEGDTAPIEAK
ncbi:hypothetical protein MPLB_1490052 [Mesorhizobium sp. ORS 3324]|nr:hypothetical protein MPLB_1490052 [Mesorhizobium sp. ORS 3324]